MEARNTVVVSIRKFKAKIPGSKGFEISADRREQGSLQRLQRLVTLPPVVADSQRNQVAHVLPGNHAAPRPDLPRRALQVRPNERASLSKAG